MEDAVVYIVELREPADCQLGVVDTADMVVVVMDEGPDTRNGCDDAELICCD